MKQKLKYCRKPGCNLLLPVFLLCFFSVSLFAQENYPLGSRPAALANTYVMESDIWSVSHNQAGLGDYHKFALGFHHENRYVIEEYSLHAIALTLPVKAATFGLSYTYFGYSAYNESKIGIAYGRNFGDKISAGIQLNYHYEYISGDYQSRHALTVEGGIQYKPLSNMRIGVHVFNPTRAQLSPVNLDTLTTCLRAGLSYSPIEKFWMGVETEKSINYEMRFKSGIEYEVIKGLNLRTGIITAPFQNTFGLGFKISRISGDVAFSHHQTLGFTPHFSMQIELK
ncbi:MAG: hypothetical protein H6538_03250 [Bacteroidales bacterium]|nr:hypothetical protein [Bacteroidales bacterium]